MIDGRSVLGLIVGRGGSKGLPRKNVLPLMGRPIVAWTVEAARGSRYLDRIIVSSDDREIIDVSVAAGAEAPFVRPPALATDNVQLVPVMLHALESVPGPWDFLVMLQASSPLRDTSDIDACIECLVRSNAPTCLTVSETLAPPYQTFLMPDDAKLQPVIEGDMINRRRQDMPKTYQLNGAVCAVRVDWFKSHRATFASGSAGSVISFRNGIDIDSAEDFALAEFYAARPGS